MVGFFVQRLHLDIRQRTILIKLYGDEDKCIGCGKCEKL
ncbi:hypothetical protein DXA19_10970 [Firmicutes bacterium AM59-13]|nr:hypothetical protein DXA19_10970 [Firmicutes bacterium AM59-13]